MIGCRTCLRSEKLSLSLFFCGLQPKIREIRFFYKFTISKNVKSIRSAYRLSKKEIKSFFKSSTIIDHRERIYIQLNVSAWCEKRSSDNISVSVHQQHGLNGLNFKRSIRQLCCSGPIRGTGTFKLTALTSRPLRGKKIGKLGTWKLNLNSLLNANFDFLTFSHCSVVRQSISLGLCIVTLDLYDANRWQWNGFLNIFFVIFVLMHFWLVVLANVRRKTMMNCFQRENVSSTSTFCGSKVPGLYICCSTNVANFTSAVIIEFQYQHLIVSKTHSIVDRKSRTNALSSRLLTISSNTMHCRDIQQRVRLWSCSQPAGYTWSSMIQSNDWTNGKYHNTTTLSWRFLFLCDMRTTQTDRYMEEFWISMFELLN